MPVANAGAPQTVDETSVVTLTAAASSDADNDALTYTWEQLDEGPSTNSKIYTDDGQRPLFRSFSPTSSPSRSFPKNSDVLSGTSSYGEMLPTTTRDLNFMLTVRDGKGGVKSDSRKLSVSAAAGPFKVTIPGNTSWVTGAQTVTWDVAGTTATPVSCSKVDISFSTDGGQSFNTVLLANSDNDGSEVVQIPNLSTSKGRIKVQCSSQPFFAINSQDIAISGNGSGSNTVPTAVNDSFTMTQSQNVNNLDVLANDSDVDAGDTLTITAVSDVNDGFIVSIAADQKSISFKHADGYSGSTLFRYTISDGSAEATTEVNVTVNVVPYVPSTVSNTSGRSSDGGSSGGGSHDWYFLFALLGLGVYRLRSNGFLKF